MTFTFAKYTNDSMTGQLSGISVVHDAKTLQVPIDPANRHYAEIMRQVEAGTLTIADAD